MNETGDDDGDSESDDDYTAMTKTPLQSLVLIFIWFSQSGTFCARSHLTLGPIPCNFVCVCVWVLFASFTLFFFEHIRCALPQSVSCFSQWLPFIPACVVDAIWIESDTISISNHRLKFYKRCSFTNYSLQFIWSFATDQIIQLHSHRFGIVRNHFKCSRSFFRG